MIRITGLLLAAALASYGIHAFAQMRADARPAMVPIGTSSSNGISFAWFFDGPGRTVVACRTGPAPADAVECRSSPLPQ